MKIFVIPLRKPEILVVFADRLRSSAHSFTEDPLEADLILFAGNFSSEPHLILQHPLYLSHPEKCAAYTEDDTYLPLLPGIYCSGQVDEHSRAGRTSTYSYVYSIGEHPNPFISNEPAPKTYLFSFMGGSTSILRKRLFNVDFDRTNCVVENTSNYHHWEAGQSDREDRQRRYAEVLSASHFVLCPRGAGTGSIRLFEVMQAGIAPVLISDDYLLPPHVPWESFLLRVPEKEINRLPELLEPQIASSVERGRLAREAWLSYFAPEKEFDALVAGCMAALHHGPPDEKSFRRKQARMVAYTRARTVLRAKARSTVLKILKVLHIKSPYQLNR